MFQNPAERWMFQQMGLSDPADQERYLTLVDKGPEADPETMKELEALRRKGEAAKALLSE